MTDKAALAAENEIKHINNVEVLKRLGLKDEQIQRTVTTTVKKGTKVIKTERIVVKNKRASKILRKERRRVEREQLGKQIQSLESLVFAETVEEVGKK